MMYFLEGLDGYVDATDLPDRGWTLTNSSFISIIATGPFGGNALRFTSRTTGGMPSMVRVLPAALSGTLLRFAFWIRPQSGFVGQEPGANDYFLSLENAGLTNFLDIGIDAQGALFVCKAETGRSVSTDNIGAARSSNISDGKWHHVEIEYTLSTTVGALKVWIDGEQEINLSGLDTSDGATNFSTFTQVRLGASRANDTAQTLDLDDIMIWDDSGSGFTGKLPRFHHQITTLFPNNAGNSAGFTPSAGSNYANVDETAFNADTDYNETGVQNTKDTHGFTNVGTIGNIFGVISSVIARSLTNTPTFKSVTRISTTDYDNAVTHTLATTYAAFDGFWDKSPATSAAWTDSEVNAAEFGYKKIDAAADVVRVSRQIVEVAHDNALTDAVRVTRQWLEVVIDEGTPPASAGGAISTTMIM